MAAKTLYKKTGGLLAALLLSGTAHALTVDPDQYFAIGIDIHQMRYVLLSHEPCPTPSNGTEWRGVARVIDPVNGRFDGCWSVIDKGIYRGIIHACEYDRKDKAYYGCVMANKNSFVDTNSLPRSVFGQ